VWPARARFSSRIARRPSLFLDQKDACHKVTRRHQNAAVRPSAARLGGSRPGLLGWWER
jgi:hypothetical protein